MEYTISIKKYWIDILTDQKIYRRLYEWRLYPTNIGFLLTDGKQDLTILPDVDTIIFDGTTATTSAEIDTLSEAVIAATMPEFKF